MKDTILNMFAAKKIYIEFDNHLHDAIMDKQSTELDLVLEIKGQYDEEVRIETTISLNYMYDQFIDVSLLELKYINGGEFDLSNDLQIDIAFNTFIHSIYTF
jgi:hypothetical protein